MSLSVDIKHQLGAFNLAIKFDAPHGITALFGHSGSGKTTLANIIAGIITPNFGSLKLDNRILLSDKENIPIHRRKIGYVFQEARLFPHLNVMQNLKFGQKFSKQAFYKKEFDHLTQLLGIDHLLERKPANLSGGEKQRIAIGRALLSKPKLLIMDEPLASLDAQRKMEIIPYLERLRDEVKIPILYVSHSLQEVARLATTLVVIEEGKVVKSGLTAKLLADPLLVPMLGVREAGALINGVILSHDDEDELSEIKTSAGILTLPRINAPLKSSIRIRIGAHDIILAKEPPKTISTLNILPAQITEIYQGNGPGVAVGLISGEDALLARITKRSLKRLNLQKGDEIFAILKSTSIAPNDIGYIV